MNRDYSTEELAKKIARLKKSAEINLATDIIVGFPTETRKEFYQSLEFSRNYDTVELFVYTPRPATKAAMIKGKVSEQELRFREGVLKQLENDFPHKYRYSRRGDSTQGAVVRGMKKDAKAKG